MHSTRLFKLLLLVVALVAVAHASWLDNGRTNGNAVAKRQDNAGSDSSAEESSAEAPSPTGDDTSADPTESAGEEPTPSDTNGDNEETSSSESAAESTSVQEQSTSEEPQQTTTEPPSSSSTSSSAAAEETSSEEGANETSSSEQPESTTSEQKEQQTSSTRVVSTKVEVVTKTNEDGTKETSTSTTLSTNTVALNADDSDSDGGMSDSTRNTIIGVVVGVGGAILLGAIGLVSWRIWGRRKRAEENDALMDYDHGRPYNNVGGEKTTEPPSTAGGSTAPSRSPFQQTLENYHQPTQVNASSNF